MRTTDEDTCKVHGGTVATIADEDDIRCTEWTSTPEPCSWDQEPEGWKR